jgi:Flp pilus assembly protein TadG
MLKLATKLSRATEGVAAVEFALLAPLLATLLMGTIELCNALECRQKVSSETSSIADLVAQASTVSNADLNNIFNAGNSILYPFTPSNVTVVVTSVVNQSTGANTVSWSVPYNGATALQQNTQVTVPTGIMPVGGSAILVQVTYSYASPIGQFIFGTIPMSDSFYARPRQSSQVNCTDCAS